MDAYGRVDILVNNAGILRDRSFHKMGAKDWQLVLDVHLKGTFAVTRAAWGIMREQRCAPPPVPRPVAQACRVTTLDPAPPATAAS